jgi:hypothetical protein
VRGARLGRFEVASVSGWRAYLVNVLSVQRLDKIRGLDGERTLTDLRDLQYSRCFIRNLSMIHMIT